MRAHNGAAEVKLLQEEMRRVRASFDYEANKWKERAAGWRELDTTMAEGVNASAMRKFQIWHSFSERCSTLWRDTPEFVAKYGPEGNFHLPISIWRPSDELPEEEEVDISAMQRESSARDGK